MRHRRAIIAGSSRSRVAASAYRTRARTTGLEPATTGSTVRYSNQLSYVPNTLLFLHFRPIPVQIRN